MTRPTRLVRWAGVAVIAAVVVLTVAFATRFGTDPGLVASPLIGRPAPDLTLPRLDGEGGTALQDLEGGIAVVNFWASWCLECRLEHADLVALAGQYEASGVRVLGVVFNDRPGQASAMLDELGWGYDHVLDPEGRAAIEFGVFGVPETFFVDPGGTIVAKITGPSTLDLLTATVDQILLGEAPGGLTTGTVQSDPDR